MSPLDSERRPAYNHGMIDFSRLLVCPDSLAPLTERENGLYSERTGVLYRFHQGIPVMHAEAPPEEAVEPGAFALSVIEDENMLPAPLSDALGKAVAELAGFASSGVGITLELGAGYGKLARRIMASEPSSFVITTDPSPVLLAALREAMAAEGLRPPWLVAANLRRLPFRTSFADRVVSVAGFNNVRDARLALGEAARVLKDGGKLAFAHLVLPDPDCPGALLAAEQGLGHLLNLSDLDTAMRGYDLRVEEVRELAAGKWPEDERNFVPASGDPYSFYLVVARKEE